MASHRRVKFKPISVKIQPTIGPPFTLSLPSTTKISNLKESISDRMGLSPQKMTLLLHSNELNAGTLSENSIEDGTELRLVPAIESGVTAANSVDPVAMMKHSMSGISDQQIDDFLNGKSPLSVAIRVGESVVVVNLHRAKVEEIEVEPPATKRRCIRNRRLSEEMDFLEPVGPSSSSNSSATSSLSQPQAPASSHSGLHRHLRHHHHHHHHHHHRHHHRHHHHHHHHNSNPSRTSMSVGMGIGSEEREVGLEPDSPPPPPVVDSALASSRTLPSPVHSSSRLLDPEDEPCCSYSTPSSSSTSRYRTHSVSRSVQTDPEPSKPREILKESLVLPDSGVSMKRKAVMEAISEILKKMYASSEKGRLPGCFKGRFSSEFTCDSDMREILHSKTTMTSYGTDLDEDRSGINSENEGENPNHGKATLSQAKAEENEQMRDKVKELKWKMQQSRAMKLARRKGERSPCGWMEALNCEMPLDTAVVHARTTGFCGFKRGFLLK